MHQLSATLSKGKGGILMNIQKAFELLVAAASQPDTNENLIYESLRSAGIPSNQADKLYKFTQIAWGRVFLNGMEITFAKEYFCLDADGSVITSGQLDEEPHYSFAVSNADRYVGSPAFKFMALTSSEVNAVNKALHSGSKPENLVTAPPVIFMVAPTDSGVRKAQELISNHFQSLQTQVQKKPWWKIWS